MADSEAGPVIRIIVIAVLLALLGIALALTISAARQNSRVEAVRHRGVPVQVTVTGCQGVSSGVGQGIEYWECRGTYSLGGRSYNEVIGGSRVLLENGRTVPAVAVPGQPGLLSTAAPGAPSFWRSYTAPIVLGVFVVAGVVTLLWWSGRRHRRDPRPAGSVEQPSKG